MVFFILIILTILVTCKDIKQFNEMATEKEATQYFELFLKDNTLKMDPAFISICMNHGWWDLAKKITVYYVEQNIDVSSHIYRTSNVIKNNIQTLTDILNNLGKPFNEVPPAFQWAQSSEQILLNVKYATRWDTPATLGCEHENLTCTNQELFYSVICPSTHKRFILNLTLRREILPENCTVNSASVGRAVITIEKKDVANWPYLLITKKKPNNMHPWYSMEEQLKNEPLKRSKPQSNDTASDNSTTNTETTPPNDNQAEDTAPTDTPSTPPEPATNNVANDNKPNDNNKNNINHITDEEFNLLAQQYGDNKDDGPNNNEL